MDVKRQLKQNIETFKKLQEEYDSLMERYHKVSALLDEKKKLFSSLAKELGINEENYEVEIQEIVKSLTNEVETTLKDIEEFSQKLNDVEALLEDE